jgi:addiction module HigA family antidote
MNQRMLARLIKVHSNRINEVIKHQRNITIDTDLRLYRFFGLEEGHFYNLQTRFKYKVTKEKLTNVLPSIPKRDELFIKGKAAETFDGWQ